MTREPCACEWGTSSDLHAELDELEDAEREWWIGDGDHARLAELREWDLWLERMEADA